MWLDLGLVAAGGQLDLPRAAHGRGRGRLAPGHHAHAGRQARGLDDPVRGWLSGHVLRDMSDRAGGAEGPEVGADQHERGEAGCQGDAADPREPAVPGLAGGEEAGVQALRVVAQPRQGLGLREGDEARELGAVEAVRFVRVGRV